MLAANVQTATLSQTATLPVIADPFVHLVTLIHRQTSEEQSFEVQTVTDRFADVMREIVHQKFMRGLTGFEYFEALPLRCPLPF
ncbi:MAG: hypothetical protein DCF22_00470 [Leptolyngbya sp.]|nr:MAG: hypothetical protein DCF22_00470 [Leptolyngbya sp.]